MFMILSDQFQQNIADVEMSQILDLIKTQIMQTILLPTDHNQTVEQQLELPTLLGRRFQYSIEISNLSNNQIILHGFTSNGKVNQINTFSVGSNYIIETSDSSFQSADSLLTLYIVKTLNKIVITIS